MLTARNLLRLAQHPGCLASIRGLVSLPAEAAAAPQLPPCDYAPPPYQGPSKEEVLSLRKQYLSPGAVWAVHQP